MSEINRRSMLKVLGSAPAAGLVWTEAEARQAHHQAQTARQTRAAAAKPGAFKPKFFTAHEYATVRVLVDLIIPKDERSGSATDAGVPEWMDFMMVDQPARQVAMRGGLAWLDTECVRRYDKPFLRCTGEERAGLLDEISWPQKARPELSHGVAFFNGFRDLTSSGFWTTKMGMDDLQFMGNTFVPEWKGCPEEAMKKLGVTPPE